MDKEELLKYINHCIFPGKEYFLPNQLKYIFFQTLKKVFKDDIEVSIDERNPYLISKPVIIKDELIEKIRSSSFVNPEIQFKSVEEYFEKYKEETTADNNKHRFNY